MNSRSSGGAPASVAGNIEKIIQIESPGDQPRSGSEATRFGGFVGTISFVVAQLLAFAGWVVVNAGFISQLPAFDPSDIRCYLRSPHWKRCCSRHSC